MNRRSMVKAGAAALAAGGLARKKADAPARVIVVVSATPDWIPERPGTPTLRDHVARQQVLGRTVVATIQNADNQACVATATEFDDVSAALDAERRIVDDQVHGRPHDHGPIESIVVLGPGESFDVGGWMAAREHTKRGSRT